MKRPPTVFSGPTFFDDHGATLFNDHGHQGRRDLSPRRPGVATGSGAWPSMTGPMDRSLMFQSCFTKTEEKEEYGYARLRPSVPSTAKNNCTSLSSSFPAKRRAPFPEPAVLSCPPYQGIALRGFADNVSVRVVLHSPEDGEATLQGGCADGASGAWLRRYR